MPKRPRAQRGWNERGYLPHFDADNLIQFVTFRLTDSLPKSIFEDLAIRASDSADLRQQIEAFIDSGRGSCVLKDPVIASTVGNALKHFDGTRYRLLSWVIMPNHVHVLIEQMGGHPLGDVIHSWKSFTATTANKLLARKGAFWAPDYFDRYIRDQAHFDAAVHYIHENPVKAGLVPRAGEWRWSSACDRP
jgi:REP element-mobilizing transposase RayT